MNLLKKHEIEHLVDWRNDIIKGVEDKISHLKTLSNPKSIKQVLKNDASVTCLKNLQEKFVLTPADKATNNISFTCKLFYIKRLLDELTSNTYKKCDIEEKKVIENNIQICNKLKLEVEPSNHTLPIMYWMPKMHKTPSGARFIIASSKCSTKPLSKNISHIFKLMFEQIQNYHLKSKFYSNINSFWVVKNSFPVIERLDKINQRKGAKCISTYNFSTLYTNIEHSSLIKELNDIIDFTFKGGNKKSILVFNDKAVWSSHKDNAFTKDNIKLATKHLIKECYFTVGNAVFVQTIGIPMGIDPAPFWANLYLYTFESRFMDDFRKSDTAKARKFHGCARFIDDLVCLNDGGEFRDSFRQIYPNELELKCEHQIEQKHATFLDLDIKISDEKFIYKLFDKRDGFSFSTVRMPDISSNIPSYIFYGTIMSEIIRIGRSTLLINDLIPRLSELFIRMLDQGAVRQKLVNQCNRAMVRHSHTFEKFNSRSEHIIAEILRELRN